MTPTPTSDDPLLRLRGGGMESAEIDGEVVVLDTERSRYYSVNESGAALWKALSEGTTRTALVQMLLDEFDVDEARATADVRTFLADIAAQGLLATQPVS